MSKQNLRKPLKKNKQLNKPSKQDIAFALKMKEVIKGLNRRMGIRMCDELNGCCLDCKSRIMIAYLNEWIDILS